MIYRADIDGLRAVAVLLVLLFHCQFAGFTGGYVGVDVFFVISGFLITGIMLADLEAGNFSFKAFYVRRARRLLPVLAVTILLTLLGAAVIMTPEHLKDTATSAVFASLSMANLHFAMESSYFGSASEIKPFLHTWSLSVEEQFYVVWPLALVACYALGGRPAVMVGVMIGVLVGLVLSEYWIARNGQHAYFLPMFRAYQFLMGAALVFLPTQRNIRWIEEGGLALGIVMVISGAVFFDETTAFPGINGLLPAVGAVLMLRFGQAQAIGRVLTLRPMVWIGQISYSVYLAHWPIIVFWRYLSADPFTVLEKYVLLGLSLGFGALLFYLVEAPLRLHRAQMDSLKWRNAGLPVLALAALAVVGVGLRMTDGLPQRMALVPERAEYAQLSRFQFLDEYADGTLQLGDARTGERVLMFGDSMMQNYIPALMQLPRFANADVTVITRGGCYMASGAVRVVNGGVDIGCQEFNTQIAALEEGFDLVIWSQAWTEYGTTLHWMGSDGTPRRAYSDGIPDFEGQKAAIAITLDRLRNTASSVVVIGPQYRAAFVPPMVERIGPLAPLEAVAAQVANIEHAPTPNRDEILRGMRAMAKERSGVSVIDPQALLCPEDSNCRFYFGRLSAFMDPSHHTAAATPWLADALKTHFPHHANP